MSRLLCGISQVQTVFRLWTVHVWRKHFCSSSAPRSASQYNCIQPRFGGEAPTCGFLLFCLYHGHLKYPTNHTTLPTPHEKKVLLNWCVEDEPQDVPIHVPREKNVAILVLRPQVEGSKFSLLVAYGASETCDVDSKPNQDGLKVSLVVLSCCHITMETFKATVVL